MTNFLTLGAAATALLGCVTDLHSRRIPNALTLGSAIVAIGVRFASGGGESLLAGAAGWGVGLLVFLPLFVVRGIGGGDVKLMAAMGAWIGPMLIAWTGLFGAIAGGVFGVVVALWHGYLGRALRNVGLLLTTWRVAGVGAVAGMTLEDSKSPKLAYALPLTCGLLVTLWLKA